LKHLIPNHRIIDISFVVALQAVQISLTSSTGAALGVWTGVDTAKKVGYGCTFTSAGLGVVNSPVCVYKERQLTKEDSELPMHQ
jgi:hypothetical protein